MRVHERVLNDAINYAQKGCAMQMWGISLRENCSEEAMFYSYLYSWLLLRDGCAARTVSRLFNAVRVSLQSSNYMVHMKENTTQAIKRVQSPDTKTQKPSGKNWANIPQPNAGALTSGDWKWYKIAGHTKRNDLNKTWKFESWDEYKLYICLQQ